MKKMPGGRLALFFPVMFFLVMPLLAGAQQQTGAGSRQARPEDVRSGSGGSGPDDSGPEGAGPEDSGPEGADPDPDYRLIQGESFLQSKNVYLLTLFGELPELRAVLCDDSVLSRLAARKRKSLQKDPETCGDDPLCYSEATRFTEAEISLVSNRLKELMETQPALQRLVTGHLIPSGCYQLQYDRRPGHYLAAAWEQDARAVNHAINVYARGEEANYPKIDSMTASLRSRSFLANIQALGHVAEGSLKLQDKGSVLFFQPSLSYAMRAIEMNGMERAADYEPMELTINKPAAVRAGSIDWSDYAYPLILIPGAGSDNYLEPISPGGVLRCQLGAAAYRQKLAPFIMVSGGNVHPYKTPNNEAIQMRDYLMKLGVPEEAILLDPHARHTTTNMRNAVRILFRYGFPVDKPAVTVTTPAQSSYIGSELMQERCRKELGYSPYSNGKRLSATTLEFYPQLESLQIDEDEPLDP